MSDAVERELQERTSGRRIFALDAIRGVAAFVVIWYHFRLAFETTVPRWWVRPLVSGHEAVVLFFVLSGYVLSLPVWRGRQLRYRQYLLRRVFRIYVPYAAAVVVAAVAARPFLFSRLPLTPWFQQTWQTAMTPGMLLREFLMLGHGELNTAFWSLRFEMQMSIIFPVVCWVLLRLGVTGGAVFGLAIAGLGLRLESASMLWGSCFVLGAVLAKAEHPLARMYGHLGRLAKVFLLAGVVATYFSGNNVLTAVGACGVLLFAERSRARMWLDTAVPEYLGRISYSLYLTHGTVLYVLLNLLFGRLPTWVLAVLYLAISLGVAHGFCVVAEEPATRLGRRLSQASGGR